MPIQGTGLKDKNVRFRFFGFVFLSIIAFASILYWRQQNLVASEYVYFDQQEPLIDTRPNGDTVLRSKNYQIETSEDFPAVK